MRNKTLKILSNFVLLLVFSIGHISVVQGVSAKKSEITPYLTAVSYGANMQRSTKTNGSLAVDRYSIDAMSLIHFAVIGDYGVDGQAELDVANRVKSWNPDFIVTAGDNNYDSGAASTIDANIGKYYHDFIFPYTGSYGGGASTNRFFPILGNHDWIATNAQPYLNYFTLPGNERYYDFIQGPVHFFMLDSDIHEPDGITSTSVQANWLRNSLASSTSPWNVVFLHHAPFSSSSQHGSDPVLQWPFEAWGADAVFSGNDHTYERISKGAIPYFVNGIGGASLYAFGSPVSGSQLRYNSDYGAMLVEAATTYINFKMITRKGVLVDSFTLGTLPIASVTSITRANASPTNASTVDFTVIFSDIMTGVDKTDFTLTITGVSGVIVSGVSGSSSIYTVTVNTGGGSGTIRLDVTDNDSIKDPKNTPLGGVGVGNGNFTGGQTYNIDKTAPIIASSLNLNSNPTLAVSVNFIVTFSESVIGVDKADFNLTTTGVSGATVGGVSGSGNAYTVTVNTGSGNGTIRLNVTDNDSIKDLANNPLGGTGTRNGDFSGGQVYTVIKSTIFADVPFTYWAYGFIERLYNAGITGGCSTAPLNYCPDNTVTRAQMAVFLLKGMHGSGYTPPVVGATSDFGDVSVNYWAAAWIKQLAAEGITGGCSGGNYCPDLNVTRAQMAIFLLKAKHGPTFSPPNAVGVFVDVPVGYWADKWIEQLAAEGITGGCGGGNYCPDISVTRAEMAVFLVKMFNLP